MADEEPMRIADIVGRHPNLLQRYGTVNIRLDQDNPFYIDPRLLARTRTPEFKGAYDELHEHLSKVLFLMAQSKKEGDRFWKMAEMEVSFSEPPGFCLGWGQTTTRGRGIGRQLRRSILRSAADALAIGNEDVRFFEFLILLDSGISHDRISDMVSSILYPRFLRYSERVYRRLEISGAPFPHKEQLYLLPRNPQTNQPVVLVPRELLALLPRGRDHGEVVKWIESEEELRRHFNHAIGTKWQEKVNAGILRQEVLSNRNLVKPAVTAFTNIRPQPYDFRQDKRAIYLPTEKTRELVERTPIGIEGSIVISPSDAHDVVMRICQAFKEAIELNGGSLLLWHKGQAKHERFAQKLFQLMAVQYCKAYNLDLSPEVNSGRGCVDFKVSRGAVAKVVVEMKLARNQKLEHGYRVQLPEYVKAEEASSAVLVVVDYRNDPSASKRLETLLGTADSNVPIVVVHAEEKASASVFDPKVEMDLAVPDHMISNEQLSTRGTDGDQQGSFAEESTQSIESISVHNDDRKSETSPAKEGTV